MSGPKSGYYERVESAEERRARLLREARSRLEAHQWSIDLLTAQAGAAARCAGAAPRLTVTADTLDRLPELEAAAGRHKERLRAAVQEQVAEAGRLALEQSLASLNITVTATFDTTARTQTERTKQHHSQPSLADTWSTRLASITAHAAKADPADRDAVTPYITAAHLARENAADDLPAKVIAAEAHVNRIMIISRERREVARQADELRVHFHELPARQVEEALTDVHDAAGLHRARTTLEAALSHHVSLVERRHVLEQTRAVLESMGYSVADTAVPGAAGVTASHSDFQHHGLRMIFPADGNTVFTWPVATGSTDERDDVAFEQHSCGTIDTMCRELEQQGVKLHLARRKDPGEVPIRREQPTTKRREAQAPKERTLGS